jgi:hypothetical protein
MPHSRNCYEWVQAHRVSRVAAGPSSSCGVSESSRRAPVSVLLRETLLTPSIYDEIQGRQGRQEPEGRWHVHHGAASIHVLCPVVAFGHGRS